MIMKIIGLVSIFTKYQSLIKNDLIFYCIYSVKYLATGSFSFLSLAGFMDLQICYFDLYFEVRKYIHCCKK